eukprot:625920-Amphidinium_carterae.1
MGCNGKEHAVPVLVLAANRPPVPYGHGARSCLRYHCEKNKPPSDMRATYYASTCMKRTTRELRNYFT